MPLTISKRLTSYERRKVMITELHELEVINDPKEAYKRMMELWPKEPLKWKKPSFGDISPEAQESAKKIYEEVFGKNKD